MNTAVRRFLRTYTNLLTQKSYGDCLAPMCDHIGGSRHLSSIRTYDIEDFLGTLYERDPPLSIYTIRKYITTIKRFFNFCTERSYIKVSPAQPIKRPKAPKKGDRGKMLPNANYEKLLAFSKYSPRHHALVLFLGDTGCRADETNNVKLSDIDFETGMLTVKGKFSKKRPVKISEETRAVIQHWVSLKPKGATPYVFSKDKHIKTANLQQLFRRLCIRAGIGSWGPHSARHRFGWNSSDDNVAMTSLRDAMGHSDVTITMQYMPDDWEHVEAVFDKAAKRSKPKPKSTSRPTNVIDFQDIG